MVLAIVLMFLVDAMERHLVIAYGLFVVLYIFCILIFGCTASTEYKRSKSMMQYGTMDGTLQRRQPAVSRAAGQLVLRQEADVMPGETARTAATKARAKPRVSLAARRRARGRGRGGASYTPVNPTL